MGRLLSFLEDMEMAALTADSGLVSTVGNITIAPLSANAADTYYRGSIVFIDAAGGVQIVPALTDHAVGVSVKQQVVAAAGDIVEVMVAGLVWLPVGTNIAAEDEGDILMLNIGTTQSDNPADWESAGPPGDQTAAVGDIGLGKILRVTSTQMLINIDPQFFVTEVAAAGGWQ